MNIASFQHVEFDEQPGSAGMNEGGTCLAPEACSMVTMTQG